MKRLLLIALALAALSAVPLARAHAAGVNLSWDDCGNAGVTNKCFACDANTGALRLVGSFRVPFRSEAILGEEIVLDIGTESTVLPDWWKFRSAGACRQQSLGASVAFADSGLGTCATFLPGNASFGITNYLAPYVYANRARVLIVYTRPADSPATLETDLEYYGMMLRIDFAHTVGEDACSGCLTPATLVLNETKVIQAAGLGDLRLQNPLDRNSVTWQPAMPYPCTSVPVRNSTWGAIKGQYR